MTFGSAPGRASGALQWITERKGMDMAVHDLITLRGEHGEFQTRAGVLDLMIQRYLPASAEGLQEEIRGRLGEPDYTVATVAEGLMILAELDGFATNV